MEQIGGILKERVQELHKLQQNVSLVQKEPQFMKDCLRELLRAKKQEKIRAAIEVFEKVSYDVMKYIHPNLQVRTVFSGKLPQILELFTSFFVAIEMKQKANEIFKIFANNLCNKFSFICLLLNILIDTVKKKLSNFIKAQADEITKQIGRMQQSPKKESNLLNPNLVAPPVASQTTQRQNQQQQKRLSQEAQTEGKSSTVLINLNEKTFANKDSNSILIQNSNQILYQDDTNKQTIKSDSNCKNATNLQNNSLYNFMFENIDKGSVCDAAAPSSPTKIKDLLKKQEEFRQFLGDNNTSKVECQSNLSSHRGNLIQLQKPIPANNIPNMIPLSPNKKFSNIILQRPQNHFNKKRGTSQNQNIVQQDFQSFQGQGNTYSTSSTSTSVPKRHTSLKQSPNTGQIQQLESYNQQISFSNNLENNIINSQISNNNSNISQINNNIGCLNQNNCSSQKNNLSITNSNTMKQIPDKQQGKEQLKINWNEIYNLINSQGGSYQFNVKYQNSQYNQTTKELFGMFFNKFMEVYKTSCTVMYELDVYYPYQMKTQLKKSNTNPKDWANMNINNILMCMLIKNSHVKQSINTYNEQFNQYKKKKKNTSRNSSCNNNNSINKNAFNNPLAALSSKIQIQNNLPKTSNFQISQYDQPLANEPNYAKPLKRYSFYKQQSNTQRQIDNNSQNSNQKAISCNTMQNLKQTTQTMVTQGSQINEDIDIPFYYQNNITKLPSLNIQNQSSEAQKQIQKQHTQNKGSEKEKTNSLNRTTQQDKNAQNYSFEDAAILKQQNNTYLLGNSQIKSRQKTHQRSISEFRKKLNIINNSELIKNNENQPYQNNTGDVHLKFIKINQKNNIQYQPESFVNALNSYSNQDILLQKKEFTPSKINKRFNLSSLPDKQESQSSNETSQKDIKDQTDYIQKIKELQKNIQICSIHLGSEQKQLSEAGYLLNLPSYRQKHNKSEMNTPIKSRISQTNRPREYSCNSNNNNNNQNNSSNLNSSSNNCINIQIINHNENNSSLSQINKSSLNFSNKKFTSSNIINNSYTRQLSKFIHKSYDYPVNLIEDQKLRHQQLTESILQESYPLLHINNSKKILQPNEHSQSQIMQNSNAYPIISKFTHKIQDH